MKTIINIFFALIIINTYGLAQSSELKSEPNAGFKKLSFEVELNKTTYLPFEPIFVKFTLSNQTNNSLAIDPPEFLLHSSLKITNPQNKTILIARIMNGTGGGERLPGPIPKLQPRQFYEEEAMPAINPEVFSASGHYQLQFVLRNPYGGVETIESNTVDITIKKPSGINKEAYNFLEKNGKDIWFLKMLLEDEKGIEILKIFVEKHSQSDYGEYAIYALGNEYYLKRDYNKAQIEFEKIKFSNNKFLANMVNKSLDVIEEKCSEQQRKP